MRQRNRSQGGNYSGWARGRPQSPASRTAKPPSPEPPSPAEETTPTPASGLKGGLDLASAVAAEWAPTAGRVLLGLVMLWFGYHELLRPGEWTGYLPVISESSSLAIILVLAHGWLLLVLSAALASLLMLEIVISLAATGLSDTALRDVGVLGLAVCLTGGQNQRLVLRT